MTCILCHTTGTPLREYPAASVCNNCGFVYVPERRSSDEIAADWAPIYGSGGYDPKWPGVQARLYYVAKWVHTNFYPETVFDIGAGDGSFLRQVNAVCVGTDVCGLEPTPMTNPPWIVESTWEDFDPDELPWDKADVATINWTLENCGDPIGMLKFAASIADKVVVSTGSRICVPFKKPIDEYFGDNPPDTHAWRWSRRSLGVAMCLAGMEVVQTNDYRSRDEMIVVGAKTHHPIMPEMDSPSEVRKFFTDWENCRW